MVEVVSDCRILDFPERIALRHLMVDEKPTVIPRFGGWGQSSVLKHLPSNLLIINAVEGNCQPVERKLLWA